MKTLGEFIVEKQQDFPHATGELTALLSAIKLGAKIIHRTEQDRLSRAQGTDRRCWIDVGYVFYRTCWY